MSVIDLGFDYGCSEIVSETGTFKGRFIIWRFNNYNRRNKTFGENCFVKKDLFNKVEQYGKVQTNS